MILYQLPVVRRVLTLVQAQAVRLTKGFTFGSGLSVLGWPVLRCAAGARVSVGSRFVMISDSAFSAVGVSQPCLINAMEPGAVIQIGDDVGISGASICSACSVSIGNRVMLGADTVITDTDFHPVGAVVRRGVREGVKTAPVVIEDDVFIGMRAIVLKGVTIGKGAVVGAGSVVVSDVPAYSIAAGHPARIVGSVASGAA